MNVCVWMCNQVYIFIYLRFCALFLSLFSLFYIAASATSIASRGMEQHNRSEQQRLFGTGAVKSTICVVCFCCAAKKTRHFDFISRSNGGKSTNTCLVTFLLISNSCPPAACGRFCHFCWFLACGRVAEIVATWKEKRRANRGVKTELLTTLWKMSWFDE